MLTPFDWEIGQRVELGEIEEAVYKHPGVKTVSAIVLGGVLVVFTLVGDEKPSADEKPPADGPADGTVDPGDRSDGCSRHGRRLAPGALAFGGRFGTGERGLCQGVAVGERVGAFLVVGTRNGTDALSGRDRNTTGPRIAGLALAI